MARWNIATRELAAEVGRVLGKTLPYEQITVSTFLEMLGLQDQQAMRRHFEAVTLDQQDCWPGPI